MASRSPPPPPRPPPNAAREIFQMLLASSIGRCMASGRLCRLSISLKCFHDSDPPSTKVSVSDTGDGSSVEEFQCLDDLLRCLPASAAAKWDGVLFVTTTCIGDKEVYRHRLDLREAEAAAAARLSCSPKNGRKFSGTEVVLSVEVEGVGEFAKWVTGLVCEAAILRIPTFAFLLEIEHIRNQGTKVESIPLESYVLQPLPSSSIERLFFGLEHYVYRHGNALHEKCQSCFPNRENLKVGKGIASSRKKGDMVEVVIVIAEISDPPESSCSWASIMKNEALYFQNHLPSATVEVPWCALKSVDWHSYGFSLEPDFVSGDGHMVLKCENLPPSMKIVIAIHYYKKKYPLYLCQWCCSIIVACFVGHISQSVHGNGQYYSLTNIKVMLAEGHQKIPVAKNLVRKAINIGLDDLKVKYKGLFLSHRALKIQKYVPDLSQAIAGLILSSSDQDFQYECASLLGLQPLDIRIEGKVESCILEKVSEIIEMNDKKKNVKETAACLFEWENAIEKSYDGDEEEELSIMDF